MFNATPSSPASIAIGYPFATPPIGNKARLDVFNDFYLAGGEFRTILTDPSEVVGTRSIALNFGTGDATGAIGVSGGTSSPTGSATGVRGTSISASNRNIGIHGVANNASVWSIGGLFEVDLSATTRNHGVMSSVTNSSDPTSFNRAGEFDVVGCTGLMHVGGEFNVLGNTGGQNIGVRATVPTAFTGSPTSGGVAGVTGDWAGFFDGDVYGSGGYLTPSDRNLKKEITPIENSLDVINRLNPVNYLFDTDKNPNMGLPRVKQWGFISQEVKEILPELTKQTKVAPVFDNKGNEIISEQDILTLNYQGFIAILTDAIQEQQKEIDELKEMIGMMKQTNDVVNPDVHQQDVELSNKEYVVLNQNVPNPFAEQTTISYVIPESAQDAQIIFYDAIGKMIKSVVISERGNGRLNVYADDLSSGVYSYSLFVDSKLIDTKKMVKK
jgi:hypothetical protein